MCFNMKYLVILLVLLSSCSLERRLEKYCPLCTQKDSTVFITQIRDTTINIPGETVYIEDTLFCDSLGNVYASRLAEKDGTIIKLQSRIKDNKYKVIAKVDTIYRTVRGNTIYKTQLITKTQKPQKIKYIPGWINFLAWVGGIFLIILILYILYRLIKSKIIML
jgi:hypothetical protein